MEKLASLLVDAVNEADTLADETAVLIHSVRLKAIRDGLDRALRSVQEMQRQARAHEEV